MSAQATPDAISATPAAEERSAHMRLSFVHKSKNADFQQCPEYRASTAKRVHIPHVPSLRSQNHAWFCGPEVLKASDPEYKNSLR